MAKKLKNIYGVIGKEGNRGFLVCWFDNKRKAKKFLKDNNMRGYVTQAKLHGDQIGPLRKIK